MRCAYYALRLKCVSLVRPAQKQAEFVLQSSAASIIPGHAPARARKPKPNNLPVA